MGLFRDNESIIQMEHNRVKNPNWREANQLAINKGGRGFELGTTENKSRQRLGWDLNSGPSDYKSSALTSRPPFLHKRRVEIYLYSRFG